MNAAPSRYGPTLGLLYGATFWGVVWYPSRLLEQAGILGPWLTLISYGAAFLVFLPFARHSLAGMRRQAADVVTLIIAAGFTNVAFVLAVLEGEVVRVLLLFYLSPLWTILLGRWLLAEMLSRRTWLMLGLGVCGAVVMLWDPAIGRVPINRADVLAIGAGFAFALNNVMTRRITAIGVRSKTHLAWLGVLVISVLFVGMEAPAFPQASSAAWFGTAALGIGGFLVSTLAVVYGVTHMPVQRSAVIMLFELIVGAVSAWWLAGEAIETRDWLGGGLILAAALLAIFEEGEAK